MCEPPDSLRLNERASARDITSIPRRYAGATPSQSSVSIVELRVAIPTQIAHHHHRYLCSIEAKAEVQSLYNPEMWELVW